MSEPAGESTGLFLRPTPGRRRKSLPGTGLRLGLALTLRPRRCYVPVEARHGSVLKRILFVCSGNTCRSPLAEAAARAAFERAGLEVTVGSAGVSAMEGMPASENSILVAGKHRLDLTGHRARLLSGELVRGADLIVTMGRRHRDTVGVIDPDALAYTRLLTDFGDDADGDIDDPVGGDERIYEQTYLTIARCVEGMVKQLPGFDGWKR